MGARLPHTAPAGNVISLRGVSKSYRSGAGEVHAVRDVDLDIASGEFVAVMGASGSGKSTLMNLVGCLDRASAGRLHLAGVDLGTLSRRELAVVRNRQLGFVFQSFNLLARTSALENVELPMLYQTPSLGARVRRQRALEALQRVGLDGRSGHRPNQLSGGQQQRVAIARALVNEPSVLLADEPTGNLDSQTGLEIMALFQDLNARGMTILMVTHEADITVYCSRTVVMRDGRILSDTPNPALHSAAAEIRRQDESWAAGASG